MADRILNPEDMLGLLDAMQPKQEQDNAAWMREMETAFETAFSVGPNVLNQMNRIGSPGEIPLWQQGLNYGDVARNAGYEGWVADAMGLVGDLVEPGPGEWATVAKWAPALIPAARGIARGLGDVPADLLRMVNELTPNRSVVRAADGNPIRTWRVQSPGGEAIGPIAEDLGLAPSTARYHGTPEYIRGIANNSGRGDNFVVREGFPKSRVDGVLDVLGESGIDNTDLIARMEESALARIPDRYRASLMKDLDEFHSGEQDLTGFLEAMRDYFGNDLGLIPQDVGLDVILQHADDGRGRGLEVVTFGGNDTWQDLNVMTLEEARNYIPPKRR